MQSSSSVPALLIVSGSMSPAHKGHVEVLKAARSRLERAGYYALAGFLSPQNAIGAAREMRAAAGCENEPALSTSFRLLTTKLALVDDDFISLGSWEASVVDRVSTPTEVIQNLSGYVYEQIPALRESGKHLHIFYACGPGQAQRRAMMRSFGATDRGVVVVPRDDEDCFYMENPKNLFFVADPAPGQPNIVVAAQIREAVRCGNATLVSSLVAPAVARLLLAPTDAERSAAQSDFQCLQPNSKAGSLRLIDTAATEEVRDKLKKVFLAWAGPSGLIPVQDVTRLLEIIDPSWSSSELSTLSSNMCAGKITKDSVQCDALVDWLFSTRGQ